VSHQFPAQNKIVILSEAKDLFSRALARKQVLRFAQDDYSNLHANQCAD
jgi:hypothetical protein